MIRVRLSALGALLTCALILGIACSGGGDHSTGAASGASGATGAPLVCGRPPGTQTDVGRIVLRANQCLVLQEPSGALHQLFLATASNVYPALPAWSPDGTRIAFTQQTFFNGKPGADWGDDLYVMPATGGTPELVRAHAPTGEQIQGLAWSPDGKALIFGEFAPVTDKAGQIQRYDGHLRRIDLATKEETTIVEGAFSPSYSRDGKRLAFMKDEGLFVASGDGKDARLLVPARQFQTLYFPRISPDGSAIAFAASEPLPGARDLTPRRPGRLLDRLAALFFLPQPAEAHGVPMDIWRVDTSTQALTRVTKISEDDPQPAWSPDGKTLVIYATGGLYRVPADATAATDPKLLGPGTFGGQLDLH
jgi:Tol biopolymer transport system component